MTKRQYEDFRLDDLTWGINVRDYPSEIEDKQSLSLLNFNFDWNKLVSEKWFEDSGNPDNWLIGALKINGDDKWTFSSWSLYKNWEIQSNRKWILLYMSESSFVADVPYSLSLDWTEYLFEWSTIEEIIQDIEDKVGANYNVVAQEDTILITKDSGTISYVENENQTYIIFNRDVVANYTLWDNISTKIEIDWVEYSNDYIYENGALNVGELDIDIMKELITVIPTVYSPTLVYLDSALSIVTDYDSEGWFAGILINQAEEIEEKKLSVYKYRIRWYSEDTWWGWYYRLDDWTDDEELFFIDWNPIVWMYWYKIKSIFSNSAEMSLSTLTIDWETFTVPAWTERADLWEVLYAEMSWNTFYRDDDQYWEAIHFMRKDWVPISSISWTWEFSDFSQIDLNERSFTWALSLFSRDNCYDANRSPSASEQNEIAVLEDNIATNQNNLAIEQASSDSSQTQIEIYETAIDRDQTAIREIYASASTANKYVNFEEEEIDSALKLNIIHQINSLSWYSAEEWYLDWKLWIIVTKWDWVFMNITYPTTSSSRFESVDFSPWDDWYSFIEKGAFIDIKTNSVTSTQIVDLQSWLDYSRWNIVVWQDWWVLYVDKDNGWAYYYYDWMRAKIWTEDVGEPTVWTIYNGKIVLGWYEWNDNIVFSKTSSPTQPLNLLNFTDYSAGWQSVSWWDKWLITWMLVWENWIYIFKNNSIWYSNSEKDDVDSLSFNLIFNKITSNWALTQNVITEVDQETLYLDWKTRAVRRLSYEQNLTTLRDTRISNQIQKLLDELPEEQPLATSSFSYPNYQLSLTDWTTATIQYGNWDAYHLNNKHFVYNVENKSWTTRDWITDMIVSYDWHFAHSDWKVYIDFKWNTSQDWESLSKEYTFLDDVDFKRLWEVEIIWDIRGEGWTKKLHIEVIVDWEASEIWLDGNIYRRTVEASDGELNRFREKIDLFDEWRIIQFKLYHEWEGRVELSDVNFQIRGIKWTHLEYY